MRAGRGLGLRGLSHKSCARERGSGEKDVRQKAAAIAFLFIHWVTALREADSASAASCQRARWDWGE